MKLTTVAAALGASLALAQPAAAAGPLERHWLQEAARAQLTEIAGARIAATRATNPVVKNLATRMEREHQASLNAIAKTARARHVAVPGTPSAADHWALHVLTTLTGAPFDRMYAWYEEAHHVQVVADAQAAASTAESSTVRTLARRLLPSLRAELRAATAAKKAAG